MGVRQLGGCVFLWCSGLLCGGAGARRSGYRRVGTATAGGIACKSVCLTFTGNGAGRSGNVGPCMAQGACAGLERQEESLMVGMYSRGPHTPPLPRSC